MSRINGVIKKIHDDYNIIPTFPVTATEGTYNSEGANVDELLNRKQDKLTPGDNITIIKDSEGNTIIDSVAGNPGIIGYDSEANLTLNKLEASVHFADLDRVALGWQDEEDIVVFPQKEIATMYNSGMYYSYEWDQWLSTQFDVLVVGHTYEVIFDGVKYTSVAKVGTTDPEYGEIYIGNYDIYTSGSTSGDPYLYRYNTHSDMRSAKFYVNSMKGASGHTLKITDKNAKVSRPIGADYTAAGNLPVHNRRQVGYSMIDEYLNLGDLPHKEVAVGWRDFPKYDICLDPAERAGKPSFVFGGPGGWTYTKASDQFIGFTLGESDFVGAYFGGPDVGGRLERFYGQENGRCAMSLDDFAYIYNADIVSDVGDPYEINVGCSFVWDESTSEYVEIDLHVLSTDKPQTITVTSHRPGEAPFSFTIPEAGTYFAPSFGGYDLMERIYDPGKIHQIDSSFVYSVDNKVNKNNDIEADTRCKITYDYKGLVTEGADLEESDIPALHLSKVSDVTASATQVNYLNTTTSNVQNQLNGKQAKLISGTNIKTINSTSILGSGNLALEPADNTILKQADVVNNLTSTLANKPLSANQGRELKDLINALPGAMVFKGSLGTGGTITALPTATIDTIGYTYQVIIAGTYDGKAASVGDLFVCNDVPSWVLLPTASAASGTVKNIATTDGIIGGPITTLGTIALEESGVTPGTYTKVTVDKWGRTTVGANLVASDLPISAGTGISITSGEIGHSNSVVAQSSSLKSFAFDNQGHVTMAIEKTLGRGINDQIGIIGHSNTAITAGTKGQNADFSFNDVATNTFKVLSTTYDAYGHLTAVPTERTITLANMTGATSSAAGKRGLVPKPNAGDNEKALFGDATFKEVEMPTYTTITVPTTGWTLDTTTGIATITISLTGAKAGKHPIVSPLITDPTKLDDISEAFYYLMSVQEVAGGILLTSNGVPAISYTLQVKNY